MNQPAKSSRSLKTRRRTSRTQRPVLERDEGRPIVFRRPPQPTPGLQGERPTPDRPGFTLTAVDDNGYEVAVLRVPALPGRVWHPSVCAWDIGCGMMHDILIIMNETEESWAECEAEEQGGGGPLTDLANQVRGELVKAGLARA
jgi:hypothetical protein